MPLREGEISSGLIKSMVGRGRPDNTVDKLIVLGWRRERDYII
jgi:hypothetical protein